MLSEDKYFHTLTQEELWERYCGFLDLSIEEFMRIQKELLINTIKQVGDSPLGKKIMNNHKPRTVEEFRSMVPLTTYEDYEPYLSERQDDALAEKPYFWCHSAGRGGSFKWIPHSAKLVEKAIRSYLAAIILTMCNNKGDINLAPQSRLLAVLPPPPYASGSLLQALTQRFSLQIMPPLEGAGTMEFQERIKKAFQMTIKDGVDIIGAIASVMVRIGEQFTSQTRSVKLSPSMLHPKIVFRLLRAWLRAKGERRGILPKDIWQPKGILVSGVDTAIYKSGVVYYWGITPHEIYAGTEGLAYAVQGWNRKGMIFFPDIVFLEFIPHEESIEDQNEENQQPSTVLLDEVEEGKLYEVVITNFYGMPLLRYRLNDVIKVIATEDDEAGINLPQITFQRRVGEVINLGGLCWLDEKTIWQAIVNTGIKYTEWVACKEYDQNQSFLRIYLEPNERKEASYIETLIDEQLKIVDTDYKDIQSYLGLQPVRVTLLSAGTFQRYMEEKIKQGANLAHLKPAHINPSKEVIERLTVISSENDSYLL